MRLSASALTLALATVVASCAPTNPFDPEAPKTLQAKAQVQGELVVSGCASAAGISVVLVQNDEVVLETETLAAGGKSLDGAFTFSDVTPGRYTLEVRREGLPPGTGEELAVLPGDVVDLGRVVVVPPVATIEGGVRLADNAPAEAVTVIALGTSAVCGDAAQVSQAAVVNGGTFHIDGLPPGTYEVRAFRNAYTPDREPEVQLLTAQSTSLSRELLLHPATAVLHVVDDIGAPVRFTRARQVNVEVLGFGGFTQMRLATDLAAFDDPDAGFSEYTPVVSAFDLGSVDGPITLFGQLRDGNFASDVYTVTVTLDTQAPTVRELVVDGGARFLSGNEGNVRLIAADTLSGVAGFQIDLGPLDDVFDLTGTPAGFAGDFVRDEVLSFQDGAGAFTDGEFTVRARVIDGAGNVSDEATTVIRRDTTPPAVLVSPGLVVENAVAGTLFGKRAELLLALGADDAAGVDGPVSLEVEQLGVGRVFDGAYVDRVVLGEVTGGDGQSLTFRATARDLAGNARVVDAAPVTLNLRGRIFGTVLLDGIADVEPLHGGTTIEAVLTGGADVRSVLTAGNGSFSLDDLPAGEWVVRALRAGTVTQTQVVSIAPGISREVFFGRISLARGALSGVFEKAGLGPGEDHAGILVEAVHEASGFRRQVFTSGDGSVLLENLPERIADAAAGEAGYEIVASAAGFAAARLTGVSVLRDQTIALNDAASPIVLARRVGDFEICNVAPVNDTCVAVTATRLTSVFLNLRAENVTHVRIAERTTFADPNDATDAAFTPFPALDASPFAVPLSAPDGSRRIFVQFKDDQGDADPTNDTLGPVLEASVILDRAPPHDIGALSVRAGFTGSFETVLDTDLNPYTNHPQARVRLALTASEDPVEEAGLSSVRVSLSPDLSSAQSFSFAGLRDVVLDAAQVLADGRRDAFVAFCDRADNCTPSAQALRVPLIVDRQIPTTLNGLRVKADNGAPQVVRDPATAPDDGVFTTFVTSTSLPVSIAVGTDPAPDVEGGVVPEVAAIRLSLEPTFLGRSFIELDGLAVADGTVVIPDFGLAGVQGTQRVFAQLRDHAGNVTPIGAGNPFFFDVVLDTLPPEALVSLVTGADQSSFHRRDDPLQVRVETSGANAARAVRFSTDGLFDTEPTVALTTSPQIAAVPVGGTEGARTLVARLIDVAGNVSDRSVSFFFDVTPPDDTAFALCASCSESGGTLFANDPLGEVTLDLFAQDNSGFIDHVDVHVDGALTDADRTFTRFLTTTLSPLPGSHTVVIDFVDAAGNVRTSSPLTIVQDSTAPVPATPPVTLLSAAGGTPLADGAIIRTRDLALQLAATGADFVRLSEDSGCVSGVDLPFGTAASLAVGPSEGVQRRVFARFTDRAGNASACAPGRSFFLDQTAPNLSVAEVVAAGGLVSTRNVTVRVDATDASTGFGGTLRAHLSRSGLFGADDGDGERVVTLDADGSTQIGYALLASTVPTGGGDGLKTVQLRVIDSAGNVVQRALSVSLDETIPAKPTPIAPAANGIVATGTPAFSWTAAADASRYRIDIRRASDNVVVQSQNVTVTSFVPGTALANGDVRWSVRAFDGAGNDSGLDPAFNPPNGILLTVDAAPPTAPASLAITGGSPTAQSQPTLTWTQATDTQTPQAALSYTVEIAPASTFTTVALSGTVTGVGTFTPAVPLADGTWFWRVTVRDRAGNAVTATAATSFVVDTTAPIAVALAPVASPKRPPVILSWSLPTDADRAGVRLQVATNAQFTTPLLDSLQTDGSEDVTSLLTSGTTVFARVAAEDAVGNRAFLSSLSFAFDSTAPAVPGAGAIAVLRPDGTAFSVDAPIVDRNVNLRLNGGAVGEVVSARVSNSSDCSNPTTFSLDQPGTSNNVVPWVLAAGSAFKTAFVSFVDEAGNASACTASQRLRSTGVVRGSVTVSAGSSGIGIGSNERAGIVVTLSGPTPGLPQTAVTDGEGGYRFPAVPIADLGSTSYTLSFSKTGFTPSGTVTVTALADQEVVAGGVTMSVQTGTVSGTATLRAFSPGGSFCTSSDPQNATSITVTLDGTAFTGEQITRTVTPAANGAYSFANVPAGTYATLASRDGYVATTSPANPFALAGGASAAARNFTLDDRTAPTQALLRAQTASPTSSASATIAIDLASVDTTTPSANFRGYEVTRIALPLDGSTPSSLNLGVFSPGATLTAAMIDQSVNRFIAVPLDCAGNRGLASEATVIRDSIAPSTVQNVRVDNRDGSVVVTWNANAADEAVTGYRVYYGAFNSTNKADFTGAFAAQGPSPVSVTATANPSATLSGLINETSFFVAVTALDSAGNESAALSTSQIASPSALPLDLRFEEQLGSTCNVGTDLRGELAMDDRLAVVASNVAGDGLRIYRHDDRDQLTLVGSVPAETRNRVALFDDFAVVYGDEGTSGSTRSYDLRDPTSPTLVSASDALDSCSGCVFRAISTEGHAANAGRTVYAATYLISGTTERLATWQRTTTNRGLFNWSGQFINLAVNAPALALLQAAELIFVVQQGRVLVYRIVPTTGALELVDNEPLSGFVQTQARPAFAAPYLFVPTQSGVNVFTVTPGTRTAGAGSSGAGITALGTFDSRVDGGPHSVTFSGSRILVSGSSGQDQRVLEAFDQRGLSLSVPLADRTLPTPLGSIFLRPDNSLSNLQPRSAVTINNHVVALFHRNGGQTGCAGTHRSLQLKMFELGSPSAMAEGARIPRGGTLTTSRTTFVDLRGGVLVTTEAGGGTVRVKGYDVRDPEQPTFLSESSALTGLNNSIFFGTNGVSGVTAREGALLFTFLASNATTRRIAAVDVAFPDVGMRVVNTGSAMTTTATTDAQENATDMVVRNGVLITSIGDRINFPSNRNYLATVAVDTPSALPDWVRVQDATASTGMCGAGLYVDGDVAYVGATDKPAGSFNGNLCVADLGNPAAPTHVTCVDARAPGGANVQRVNSLDGVAGFLSLGASAIELYDIRTGPPVAAISATRAITPPGGSSQNMHAAGPFLYTTLGGSSALPLGMLLGIDTSPDQAGVPLFTVAGSLNDADPGNLAQPRAAGDVLVLPMQEADFAVFLVQLF